MFKIPNKQEHKQGKILSNIYKVDQIILGTGAVYYIFKIIVG